MATISGTSDISGAILYETAEIPVSERHVVRKVNRHFLVIGVVLFMQKKWYRKAKDSKNIADLLINLLACQFWYLVNKLRKKCRYVVTVNDQKVCTHNCMATSPKGSFR